jgi:hypothetical protein
MASPPFWRSIDYTIKKTLGADEIRDILRQKHREGLLLRTIKGCVSKI